MKKSQSDKKDKTPDIPDVKKIEKSIQTNHDKKVTEVPDNTPDEEAYKQSPVEMPERKEEDELKKPEKE